MGFGNSYRLHSTADDTSYIWNKKILEFFGFKVRKTSSSSIETYGGDTYATLQSDGKFKIETSPTGLYSRTRHYVEYYRDKQPTAQEQALEDRFVELMEQRNMFWSDAPAVEVSLETYHLTHSKPSGVKPLRLIALVLIIVGLLFFLGSSIFQTARSINPVETSQQAAVYDLFAAIDPTVAMVGAAAAWISSVILFIVASGIKTKYRNTPFSALPYAERSAIRQRYHAHLRGTYIGEMGEILVQYAILQEK